LNRQSNYRFEFQFWSFASYRIQEEETAEVDSLLEAKKGEDISSHLNGGGKDKRKHFF
jgi:hypothetical protein